MWNRLRPYGILTALLLVFFAPLLGRADGVLYSDHSDLLAMHLPAKRFWVRSVRETGEWPLWCPDRFAGAPFVHDIQVGMFYPPHWLLLLLPLDVLPAGASWLVVAQLLVGGWGMYAYARHRGLSDSGALTAAIGFMFAGSWLVPVLMAGHTVALGLAWLPVVLLKLERAVVQRSLWQSTCAGVAGAFLALGTHPQWTLYATLFVFLWTLELPLRDAGLIEPDRPVSGGRLAAALGRWLGHGLWAGIVTLGLTAIQWLPTMEAAAASSRSLGTPTGSPLFAGVHLVLNLVGPARVRYAFPHDTLYWEGRGNLPLLWTALAILAPWLGGRRERFQAFAVALLMAFACGGWFIVQDWPVFRYFRAPARMLVVLALPLAFMAGQVSERLLDNLDARRHRRAVAAWLMLLSGLALLVGGHTLLLRSQQVPLESHPYWWSLVVSAPLLTVLLALPIGPAPWRSSAWVAVALADLWALSWPLVQVRNAADIYAPTRSVEYLLQQAPASGRVLEHSHPGLPPSATPLGRGAPLALWYGIQAVGGYSPLDVRRFKEYLLLMAGRDQPLRSDEAGPFNSPVLADVPVRWRRLADLLGVAYVIRPSDQPLDPAEGWQPVLLDLRPVVFDFVGGGLRTLPPHTVYRNEQVLPRAFVVPRAESLPTDRAAIVAALRAADFRQTVYLEEWEARNDAVSDGRFQPAEIADYRPNRVTLRACARAPSYLVLTDVWFPGWEATVDGKPARVYRANLLFRAVILSAGEHEVVFSFNPATYLWGRRVSLLTLAGVGVGLAVAWGRRHRGAAGG
ncbi:MAG: YfhO family protein [Gemmataceae bacterium]|nr:YfhO family protein [Gemmataceae bacterium]MDW8266812.1 YfhO family protein [Gemmataceae bacterium]